MNKVPENTVKKQPGTAKESMSFGTDETLYHQAFDSSLQANIIFAVSNRRIVSANRAACKLLGYSKKELLAKTMSAVLAVKEKTFAKMLRKKNAEETPFALIHAIKKNGKLFPCELHLATFSDTKNIEKAIVTIEDKSQSIRNQNSIDTRKEKIVANNIILARSKQDKIDLKKDKIVAANIIVAQEQSDVRLEKNNEWIKYIAKTSYDVMWDWNIASGEIYVGDSIEEVFGYRVQNNTVAFTDFVLCLLPEEKEVVEKKLSQTLASVSKSWDDSYQFKRQDGSVAYTNSRASIVRDEEGKAVRLIGAIRDISRLQELEKKLEKQIAIQEEDGEKFLLAAQRSFDVIWDWNLATDEVFIGEGFEGLFGYPIEKNKGFLADLTNHVHPDDQALVQQGLQNFINSSAAQWEQTFRLIRADGSIAEVFNKANIIRHQDGKACRVIGTMQDLSRQKESGDKLNYEITASKGLGVKYEDNFKFVFNSSSNILFDVDLITKKVQLNDAYEKEFGYELKNNTTSTEEWFTHIHPDDKEAFLKNYHQMIVSKNMDWKYGFRFLKANNSVATVVSTCIILRNADGKAIRRIGYLQELSKQKVLEERIKQEINVKEGQIAKAWQKAKEMARLDLGRELHDNVNHLLSTSRLYLEMAKGGGKDSEMYLSRSSEHMLNAIEEIRKLAKGLTTDVIHTSGLCASIENISRDIMEISAVKINCVFEHFKEDSVNDKFKLNVFRIVQEQLNNILKHAKATKVDISLSQHKTTLIISVSDNGVGFNTSKAQKGVGINNIKTRSESYDGRASFVSQPGQGTVLTVIFPLAYALLNKRSGLKLTEDKKSKLIGKIKSVIADLIHDSTGQLKINVSDYLARKLHYDYTYLANVFSDTEGISIEKFIIFRKIERVKELLTYDELNLTQIALKLHYSSVAHLSNQFKKITGCTPTSYKQRKHHSPVGSINV